MGLCEEMNKTNNLIFLAIAVATYDDIKLWEKILINPRNSKAHNSVNYSGRRTLEQYALTYLW